METRASETYEQLLGRTRDAGKYDFYWPNIDDANKLTEYNGSVISPDTAFWVPDKAASSFSDAGELYLRLVHDSLSTKEGAFPIDIGKFAEYRVMLVTNNAEWSNW